MHVQINKIQINIGIIIFAKISGLQAAEDGRKSVPEQVVQACKWALSDKSNVPPPS
jgi:hypothetical protein